LKPQPLPVFPNYLQLRERSRVPHWLWTSGRTLSVAAALGIVVMLFGLAQGGLMLFWQLSVPVLPLVFFAAPGLWRNVCPLAAVNQLPRALSFSRGLTPPAWFAKYGYVLGIMALFALVSSRKWLFNVSGPATAWLVLSALAAAFVGGVFFKGKSGWCSSICPLYPVQRLYNRTPFVTIANSHCSTCVGCTKNCYDFNPGVAYLADLDDDDRHYRNHRKFFAAAFPGFILAYFTLPNPPEISVPAMYVQFFFYVLVSAGSFFILYAFAKASVSTLTAGYAAAALNLYYWFAAPAWVKTVGNLAGVSPTPAVSWLIQGVILALSLAWMRRTHTKEQQFQGRSTQVSNARIGSNALGALRQAVQHDKFEITFMPDEVRVLADSGRTLLEIAESNNQPIEAGCRMGMCGADPVLVLSGMEHLPPVGEEERDTLDRLGLGGDARLACMCRANGPVSLSIEAKFVAKAAAASVSQVTWLPDLAAIKRVVVIGNGIAGVTVCDHLRRYHPDCKIALIGCEKHQLYNRMAITRLIYGRSAMSGLHLQPESWYEERGVEVWLNTQATSIDRARSQVVLGTGETLDYDRLVLANGSASLIPPITNFGKPGTFVQRDADDAMQIRTYVQTQRCRRAVVAGGGLLGLEAAYALSKLGLDVTVLERGAWLLRRQLDSRGSHCLRLYLERLGIEIALEAEAESVRGSPRMTEVVLKDGRVLSADVLLAAAGIVPNVDLARQAGIDVKHGVLVDDNMRTSAPGIFAAGDVCEFQGEVHGLWPVAVEQGKVAALNALGAGVRYRAAAPVCALKVVGVELTSIGVTEARTAADIEIAQEELEELRYRKLVISAGLVVGAILIGHPRFASAVTAAIRNQIDVTSGLDELRAGRWEVLNTLVKPLAEQTLAPSTGQGRVIQSVSTDKALGA